MDLTINFKTHLESTLDVHIGKSATSNHGGLFCASRSRADVNKRHFTTAKVRLLETGGGGPLESRPTPLTNGSRFLLHIFWSSSKKSTFAPLTDGCRLIRISKPRHCLVLLIDSDRKRPRSIRLCAHSETECQRWTRSLLEALAACDRSKRPHGSRLPFSLCLSNYLMSIVDSRRASERGLDEFEYWAVLDKNVGLVLFPADDGSRLTEGGNGAVSFPFEQIARIELADVEDAVDVGKVIEIVLVAKGRNPQPTDPSQSNNGTKRSKMTSRWRRKSPRRIQRQNEDDQPRRPMTPTASLGFHTLSLFCPDAGKFVHEWKSCQKLNIAHKDKSTDTHGNRISSTSSSSHSSNLSALNSLLRRSLPSLNQSFVNTPSPTTPSSSSPRHPLPPPLPSRKELEQRESDRLFQMQLQRHWRRLQDDEEEQKEKSIVEPAIGGRAEPRRVEVEVGMVRTNPLSANAAVGHGQYKLLPADTIPVSKYRGALGVMFPAPPLPPKSTSVDSRKSIGIAETARKDVPNHYKLLSFGGEESPTADPSLSSLSSLSSSSSPHRRASPILDTPTYTDTRIEPPPTHGSTIASSPNAIANQPPPPLPPRRHPENRSGSPSPTADLPTTGINGYKTLGTSSWTTVVPHHGVLAPRVQNGYHPSAMYSRLPDPIPAMHNNKFGIETRYSLETEV